ncbi:MAG: LysM peptidoglycan-binding domain-containing protein [Desulfobacterales bacterium]|nr:LysM peptidoglycan-binding domain-containing protein [Desulfobacterales bacterium]
MKPKAKPESKIPTTQKNTNQKRKVPKPDDLAVEGSLLKKNEFTLIIVGALVVTVLVFVFFFRSSDTGGRLPTGNGSGGSAVGMDAQSLEKRIADLEVSLNRVASATPDVNGEMPSPKAIAALDDRVSRLETAVTLKMDALIERMGAMEKRIASLKSKAATVSKRKVAKPAATKTTKTVAVKSTSVPVKKKAVQSQKTAQKPAKPKQMFHTVKKGETLWSISQKYKTTVAAIRKLNNLSAQDKIYPGNNILVR